MKSRPDDKIHFFELGFVFSGAEIAFTGLEEKRFFFDLVVLEAEAFAGSDEEEFSDVVFGFRPNQLIAPGFVDFTDAIRLCGQCTLLPRPVLGAGLPFSSRTGSRGNYPTKPDTKFHSQNLIP